jgi:hypothetical protein
VKRGFDLKILGEIVMKDPVSIRFNLVNTDFFLSQADVYILKYPRGLRGVEEKVAKKFRDNGVNILPHLPALNEYSLFESNGIFPAKKILYIGVPYLHDFGYHEIHLFAKKSLLILKSEMIDVSEINVTIHGANYGLNLHEAFQSEIHGFINAIHENAYPQSLKTITISEKKLSYYLECKKILEQLLPDGYYPRNNSDVTLSPQNNPDNRLIFISCKSEDFKLASLFYEYLNNMGKRVFFSEKSIPAIGNANYRSMIDDALDNAYHMVVIGSSRENIRSPWIQHEWGFFVNEINSGRKKGNIITLIHGSLQIADLPPSLRNYEVIPFSENQFEKACCFLQ